MFMSTRAPYQVPEQTEVGTRPHPVLRGRLGTSATVKREAGKNEVGHQHVSFLFLLLRAFLSLLLASVDFHFFGSSCVCYFCF